MHPMYKLCFRCGTARPLPKMKQANTNASTTTSEPPKWATDLVKQNSSIDSSLANKVNEINIPRKIIPGLSIAKSITQEPLSKIPSPVKMENNHSSFSTIHHIPKLNKHQQKDIDVNQLSESLENLTIQPTTVTTSQTTTKEIPLPSVPKKSPQKLYSSIPLIRPTNNNNHSSSQQSHQSTISTQSASSSTVNPIQHNATLSIFTSVEFQNSCKKLQLPLFNIHIARNNWQKEFLLSIAAQITPGYDHSWKRDNRESKALTSKQRETLLSFLPRGTTENS